mmetsp:Transcript_25288/g.42002  ORF Transcript_25288/g.42002 Transcript_25288/m.42002 type:complete len:591 (-) Transcript_25288:327-2099(-)
MMKNRLFNPWVLTLICLIFFLTAVTINVLLTNSHYNSSPEKEWILVGGVTSSFASFRIRSFTGGNVTFVVSESPSLEEPTFVQDQVTATTTNGTLDPVHQISVDILTPNTKYYYATLQNDDSVIRQGSFQTPATEGEAFNFKIAVAGCAWTGSKHKVFSEIASRNPLFMLHLGDFHYEDIGENDLDLRINAVDLVMGSDSQRELFSKVPLAYTWDDHDWLGNDSDRDDGESGARNTALRSYQIAFPHHPLAVEGEAVPIYHAFTIGTVRFIVSDLRSEATGSSIYSEEQRDWLYNELSQAAQYDFVIWATSKPWIGDAEEGEDNWLGSAADRLDLSNFISTTLAETQNLLAVSSDAHMLAFDDGSNTYYGTSASANSTLSFPILQSGPMDRLGSVKGGPFSDGCHTTRLERNNQYSTIEFDFGGSEPCLEITTYDVGKEVEKRKLCGKIFTESSPGTGSCTMALYSTTTYVYVSIASFLWFVASVGACNFLGINSGFLVASILMIFLLATVFTAPIPLARGISQWNTSPTDIIAFAEMLTATIYCYIWYYLARKAKREGEEPIFQDGDSAQASKSMKSNKEPIFNDNTAQ